MENHTLLRKVSLRRYLTPLLRKRTVWVAGAMFIGILIMFLPTETHITVESENGRIFSFPIEEREEFQLIYRHSVEKTDVIEVFTLGENHKTVLLRTEQESFGAGLPTESHGELKKEGNRYIYDNINKELEYIDLRVGAVADHRIITPLGRVYHLQEYVEGKTRLRIEAKDLSKMISWLY